MVNSIIVVTKVSIVLMVIVIGWGFMNPANHTPYIPAATTYTTPQGITHPYGGIMGILGAAGVVFFAFIGFDAVSTAAQEAKNPKRDMPIGILGSLVVCTDPLRAVLARAERRGDGRGLPDRGQGSLGRLRDLQVHDRLRVAVEVRDDRDSGRLLVGHPRHADGAVARVLLDEPRRPGAEDLLRGAPEVPRRRGSRTCCSSCSPPRSPGSCRRASSAR